MDKIHYKKLYSWMLYWEELKTPAEKLAYAIIYAYPNHVFKGSQKTLGKMVGCTDRTIRNVMEGLEFKGIVSKLSGSCANGKAVIYRIERHPDEIDEDRFLSDEEAGIIFEN